jgi:hypothetical protein
VYLFTHSLMPLKALISRLWRNMHVAAAAASGLLGELTDREREIVVLVATEAR